MGVTTKAGGVESTTEVSTKVVGVATKAGGWSLQLDSTGSTVDDGLYNPIALNDYLQ